MPRAKDRGYTDALIEQIWFVLESFASFGFCKAHAAAFALPTYQSAWLKRHYPAHFLAGVLTHDPGMYPKRLLLEEARRMNISVLGLDVNRSTGQYRAERLEGDQGPDAARHFGVGMPVSSDGLPQVDGWGIRLSLADVKGIAEPELERIVTGQPYASLSDFWARAKVAEPVVERLILAGAFDRLYRIGQHAAVQRRGQVTRRDLLLALADLHRQRRADERAVSRAKGRRRQVLSDDPSELARAQRQKVDHAPQAVQAALDFGDEGEAPTADVMVTGLPEMDADQRLKAELEILGLDASQHIMERYLPLLRALGATSSRTLLQQRNQADVLVGGVKVATQTPPVRSGRRVVFLTLDDGTGPVDATFFEDVQGPYASTVFSSWLLLVRGLIRRTGPRGISIRATGAWDLGTLNDAWRAALDSGATEAEAIAAVVAILDEVPEGYSLVGEWVAPESAKPAPELAPAGRRRATARSAEPHPCRRHGSPSGAGPCERV